MRDPFDWMPALIEHPSLLAVGQVSGVYSGIRRRVEQSLVRPEAMPTAERQSLLEALANVVGQAREVGIALASASIDARLREIGALRIETLVLDAEDCDAVLNNRPSRHESARVEQAARLEALIEALQEPLRRHHAT